MRTRSSNEVQEECNPVDSEWTIISFETHPADFAGAIKIKDIKRITKAEPERKPNLSSKIGSRRIFRRITGIIKQWNRIIIPTGVISLTRQNSNRGGSIGRSSTGHNVRKRKWMKSIENWLYDKIYMIKNMKQIQILTNYIII